MKKFVWFICLITIAAICLGKLMGDLPFEKPSIGWPGGVSLPILGIELVKNEEEIKSIFCEVEKSQINRQSLESSLSLDWWFIALYEMLFLSISYLLYKQNKQKTMVVKIAILAAITGTIAAISDVAENYYLGQIAAQNCSQPFAVMLKGLWWTASIKWFTAFFALLLQSYFFLPNKIKWYWACCFLGVFLLFAGSGFIGMVGVVVQFRKVIEIAAVLMSLGLVAAAVFFLVVALATFLGVSFEEFGWKN